ncbi:MAG: PilZ domain-containing protein [Deltaproteobacteria bacterium]|nr:PilZ domain-containing protein [Deltaproteobacteria bacterium]
MSPFNLILIAEPGESKERYLKELQRFNAVVDCVQGPNELFQKCRRKKYSGILVDLKTMIKTSDSKKQLIDKLSIRLPIIRLRINPSTNSIVGLFPGQDVPGDDALRFFIEKCKGFKPSRIRIDRRINKILNVVIFQDNELDEEKGIRANIIDISFRGCFINTLHPLNSNERIWIRIKELKDTSPIQCEIRWAQHWGEEDCLPGVGALFTQIKDEQIKDLQQYVSALSISDMELR